MRFRGAVAILALVAGSLRAQAPVVHLDDAGPGTGPRILAAALSAPHDVVPPAANRYMFERGSTRERAVVVLGHDAIVEGTVRGDVIVVGGDLYMHPGGHVDGRAMAYGGGVYESALATVRGGVIAYRDFTYDITPTADGFSLRYRALNAAVTPFFALGGFYGVSIPSYDRTNGLSLPLSVVVSPGDALRIEPSLTYRSQLGRIDPWVDAVMQKGRTNAVRLGAGRTTLSNETWIRSDLMNSVHYLLVGNDTRNYYRADRAQLAIEHTWEGATASALPFVGVRVSRDSPVRPTIDATGGPWALKGRDDRDDVLRPNPQGTRTTVRSVIAGSTLQWSSAGVVATSTLLGEVANGFSQLTFDGTIGFPTFGTQRLDFDGHFVASAGTTPFSRLAYVGGAGSLPTLGLVELGGDELVFTSARYSIPVDRIQIPFVGPPTLSFREILAGAGSSGFPTVRQATGVRVSAGLVFGEVLVDPPHRRTRFSVGFSTGR